MTSSLEHSSPAYFAMSIVRSWITTEDPRKRIDILTGLLQEDDPEGSPESRACFLHRAFIEQTHTLIYVLKALEMTGGPGALELLDHFEALSNEDGSTPDA